MALSNAGPIPTIKMDPAGLSINGGEPTIKSEVDLAGLSPGTRSEEDVYEDAGDLDFSCSLEAIYLARLPKFLWKTWSQMEDDQEIQLGIIRVEGGLDNPKRMSLMLSSDISVNANVPKEYNMQVTNGHSANTFIFSEKDLSGYSNRSKNSARQRQDSASLPFAQVAPRPQFQDRSRFGSAKVDKKKPWSPYKKAVPKKTALNGHVRTEINCLPVENEEYRRVMDERAKQALKPKRETQLLSGMVSSHAGNLLAPGLLGATGSFNTFIKGTGVQRKKAQEFKATRMPQNELLDAIHECFKEYKYWPFKSLKDKLKQPEAYLKETLEKVAVLIRQGPHAMTWQLMKENESGFYQAKDEEAPSGSNGLDGAAESGEGIGSEDDEDDMKVEDTIL